MKKIKNLLVVAASLTLALSSVASAKTANKKTHNKKTHVSQKKSVSHERYGSDRQGKFQTGLGLGMVFHEPTFDLRLNSEYFVTHNISAGLNIDFLFHDDTVFSFDGVARYNFDIVQVPRLVPYVGMGLGAAVSAGGGGALDLQVADLGFRFEALPDHLFVGPDLGVHVVTDFEDTTWQISFMFLNVNYRF